ncbi:solute carrier organic anion transporter family member 2A1-like [Acanthaster planci]|uniref:Solute carrier organic anion transporter family member n=1 Tax=Acanthaster planci TaxID=133434 RepID=A0A8B7Z9L2_ACAPL|nr:solute carrier organic anion transporter family member 2A1-like [Acanthaster planci]
MASTLVSNKYKDLTEVAEDSEQKDTTDKDDAPSCSYFSISPPCLQRFARPGIFVVVASVFFFADSFTVGVIQGTLTSLEHRYQLTLSQAGMLLGAFCVGGIIGIGLLILFASRPDTNRPRILGIGALMCSLAIFTQTIPQFIQDPYIPEGFESSNDTTNQFRQLQLVCLSEALEAEPCLNEKTVESLSPNRVAYFILLFSAMFQGIFVMIEIPLAQTYISDCASRRATAFYTGIFGAMSGLSPVVGIFVAAACLGLWVDFYRLPSAIDLAPGDRAWVGAWWLGYIFCAVLYSLPAVPFLGFPKALRRSRTNAEGVTLVSGNNNDDQETEKVTKGPMTVNVRDSIKTFWKVIKNRDCVLACLSQAGAILVIYGYGFFVPKYLEVQFQMETQLADLLTGCLLAPAYAVGYILAGSLVKRFNIQYRGLVSLSCIALAICIIGFIANLFVGCPNHSVAGIFKPYLEQSRADLESPCNADCACSLSMYAPVCDGNGTTYFSACHAGCRLVTDRGYEDCSCLATQTGNVTDELIRNGTLLTVQGACDTHCISGALYLVVLTIVLLLAQFAQLLRLNVVIRCVTSEDRPVALGILHLTGLIVTLPAGYLFGAIIDSACLMWKQTCNGPGACTLYDNVWYRYSYNGGALGIGFLSFACMFLAWLFPSHVEEEPEGDIQTEGQDRVVEEGSVLEEISV